MVRSSDKLKEIEIILEKDEKDLWLSGSRVMKLEQETEELIKKMNRTAKELSALF